MAETAPSAAAPSVSYARVVRPDADTPQPDQQPQQQTAVTAGPELKAAAVEERGAEEEEAGEQEDGDESFIAVTSKKEKVKNKVDKVK